VEHPSPALFSLYEALATLLSTGGQFREALEAARRSVTLARAMNDDAMLPRAEQRHAATLFLLGQLDEATRALERVIPLAEAAGDLDILCRALNNLGHIYFNQGKFDKAKACWDRYLAVAQRINSPRRIAFASLYLGHDAWRRASWDEALRFYEQAANILRQVGRSRNGEGPVNPAAVRLLRGEEELALRDLEECVATAERTHDDVLLVAAHRWLAEYDLVQGRAEAVRARLEPLLDLLRPELNDPRPFEVLLTLASAYLEPGADSEDTQRAEDLVQQALTRAARVHSQLRLVQALPVQAMVLAQQGRWPEAQRRVNEALTLAQRLPYPLGEALALETAGMMNLRKGETDQARTFLEQALALFGRLGVGLYRARTKRLLR
jgi:tetratricopeptide (TPR) repeat protein